VLDPRLVESIASALGTRPGLVEKDWHVVRAIAVLAALDHGDARPVFGGGTSLSKGWGLIKRFSEDIDFKVAMPPTASGTKAKKACSTYRKRILDQLAAAGFTVIDKPKIRDESRFFSAQLAYAAAFDPGDGLRPHVQIEMTFMDSALPPIGRPIQSLVAQAQRQTPEVSEFPCIDPVETAADKLSALAWRVCTRQRGSKKDDPTLIRHLHDLAALESRVAPAPGFKSLVQNAARDDADRGGGQAPEDPADRFAMMLDRLDGDPLWAKEYERYVELVSFADPAERIGFSDALAALERILKSVA